MRRHQWIVEVIGALLVIMFVCYLGVLFWQTVQQENTCWAAGYETPINYRGECFCFGREGQPEVVALAVLEANGHD